LDVSQEQISICVNSVYLLMHLLFNITALADVWDWSL